MDFKNFLNQAWSDHGDRPDEVAARFPQGLLLTQNSTDAIAFLNLIQHVLGEHLGRFDEASQLYRRLDEKYRDEGSPDWPLALGRAWSVLSLVKDDDADLSGVSVSDRVRIEAAAAGMLAGRGDAARALTLFGDADTLSSSLDDKDPGVRTLAVNGNNAAAGLEMKTSRSETDTELMLAAARIARRQWARAGGWLEIERADYRLGMSFLAAGDTGRAMIHARDGLALTEKNGADPVEMFFHQELFARIHEADGDPDSARRALKLAKIHFEKISPENQSWVRPSLDALTARIR